MPRQAMRQEQPEPLSSNEERRGDMRHYVRARATCRIFAEGATQTWKGLVRDISTLGIGLVLPLSFPAGTLLEIDLENNSGNWVGAMRARVIHTEQGSQGGWVIGCAFIMELSDAEMRLFQAEKVKPAVPDGRRWMRFPCAVETVCYTCETIPGERRRAQVVNISAGGAGLLLPCEFSTGTILRLELPVEMAPARLLLLRVIHCVEQPSGGYSLGCEFADQIGAGEIQALTRK